MKLYFKDIVEALKIDAPVHYTPDNNLDISNLVYCKCMGDDETNSIIKGTHSKSIIYDDKDIGLYFPNIDIDEYYKLEKKRNPVAIDYFFQNMGSFRIPIDEREMIYSIYCVLHEYGHWIHFKNSGMASYEYCFLEKEERQPYEKIENEIKTMSDWDPRKVPMAEQYHEKIYSQFTSEKAADAYAEKNLLKSMEIIRNTLKVI